MALEKRPAMLSYADFLKLPPDRPGEVIEGEFVVGPSPFFRHQYIAGTIGTYLRVFLDENPEIGLTCMAPMDVVLRAERPAIVVQPDVLFISAERASIVENVVNGAPDLAVEVVSPSTGHIDAIRKRELYARHGIREYWLVWPEEERVDVFVLDGDRYGEPGSLVAGDTLTSRLLPGWQLAVEKVFTRPRGRSA